MVLKSTSFPKILLLSLPLGFFIAVRGSSKPKAQNKCACWLLYKLVLGKEWMPWSTNCSFDPPSPPPPIPDCDALASPPSPPVPPSLQGPEETKENTEQAIKEDEQDDDHEPPIKKVKLEEELQ
jgi:hypothetical protein